DQVGKHLEVGRTTRNVDVAGQRFGLASVLTFGLEELVKTGVDAVGNLVQDRRALLHRHPPPRAVERGTRSLDGSVDFFAAGLVHPADDLAVGRVDVVEQPAIGRTDVFTVDVMLDLFHGYASLVEQGCIRSAR